MRTKHSIARAGGRRCVPLRARCSWAIWAGARSQPLRARCSHGPSGQACAPARPRLRPAPQGRETAGAFQAGQAAHSSKLSKSLFKRMEIRG
eukprot:2354187-Prymnesium_polylepis.1